LTSQLESSEKDRDTAVEITRRHATELRSAQKEIDRLKEELSDSKFVQTAQAEQMEQAEEKHRLEMNRSKD
jgi:valyl-tRNA synthetase